MLTWLSMTSTIVPCMTFSLFSYPMLLSVMYDFSAYSSIWMLLKNYSHMAPNGCSELIQYVALGDASEFQFSSRKFKKALDTLERSKHNHKSCIEIWFLSRDIWKLSETTRGYQNSQDFSIKNKKFLRFCDFIYAIKCHQLELWSRCMHAYMFVDGENVFLPNRSGILFAYAMRMTCEELRIQSLCKF